MPAPRGKFIWYDVMTHDTKAAAAFYSDVIGWDAQEHQIPDNRIYTVFSKGPTMVAGLMEIPDALRAEDAKPCWSGYIGPDAVDADAARVAAAGGAIKRGARRHTECRPLRRRRRSRRGRVSALQAEPRAGAEGDCTDDARSCRLARAQRRRSRSRVRLLLAPFRLDQGPRHRYGRHGHLPDLRHRRRALRRHDERLRASAGSRVELLLRCR